jgi:hypothetical protein
MSDRGDPYEKLPLDQVGADAIASGRNCGKILAIDVVHRLIVGEIFAADIFMLLKETWLGTKSFQDLPSGMIQCVPTIFVGSTPREDGAAPLLTVSANRRKV